MSSENLCQICSKAAFKYRCPRCNISYCSVACYQSPNHIQCSEEFYKECVTQEMALQSQMRCGTLDDIPGLSDDIKRMYQILKRMESTQSISSTISDFDISDDELDSDDDADEGDDLNQRLEGIDLNDANAIWSKLTQSERKDFGNIVQSEDVSAILPAFHPWWEHKEKKQLITEVNNGESSSKDSEKTTHPKIFDPIGDFSKISTKPPAPCVGNNLFNVLAAYTTTVRFFCGEHFTNPQDAVTYLLLICANLKTNANFDDKSLAIESVRCEAHNEGFTMDENDVQQIKEDIDNINEGPDPSKTSNLYILAALSDLHKLLKSAKTDKKGKECHPSTCQSVQFSPPKEKAKEFDEFFKRFGDQKLIGSQSLDKSKLSSSIKKIEYYLAFAKKFL